MSLAARLQNSTGENEASKNYRVAKVFQGALFGEPEVVIEVEIPEPEPGKQETKPVTDPRPDLVEDSELWTKLLQLAAEADKQLAGTLHGFRCQGTRIVRGKNGYVLRPELDSARGWSSREEYERMRDRWLRPHVKVIVELLRKL